MITWLQLWPLLTLPTILLGAITSIPTMQISGRVVGGGPVREYFLNHILVSALPNDAASALVQWFAHANVVQEWFLSLLVVVNINGLLLPLLFLLGQGLIMLSTWFTRKNIQLKRDAIRR
jgi:hypothetical protein